jgi:hypothetical protein
VTASKIINEELRKIQFRLATLLGNLPDVVLLKPAEAMSLFRTL